MNIIIEKINIFLLRVKYWKLIFWIETFKYFLNCQLSKLINYIISNELNNK